MSPFTGPSRSVRPGCWLMPPSGVLRAHACACALHRASASLPSEPSLTLSWQHVEPFSPVRFGPVWLLPPCGVLSALACACALRLALGLLFLPCFGLLSCVVHTFTLCPDRFSCVLFSCVRPSLSFLPSAIASPCLACHLPLRVHILALLSPDLGREQERDSNALPVYNFTAQARRPDRGPSRSSMFD